jgi:DGQHR domain-containing protein
MFYAEAGDLSTWCGVYRKEISQQGYQRILKPEHANQIRKFLANEENVIPNSVVIAFNDRLEIGGATEEGASFEVHNQFHPINADGDADENTVISHGILTVRVHERVLTPSSSDNDVTLSDFRSAYVIDGQHRIDGGNKAGGNVYLPVTGFLGVSREDQAFHFIVINRKARKVSKHDIDAVIPKKIYDGLQRRLVDAGIVSTDADIVFGLDNLDDSPFKGLIIWANNTANTAVVSKGAIDNMIKEVRRFPDDEIDFFSDDEISLITTIWRGIYRHLKPIWDKDRYEKSPGETYNNQLILKAAGVFPAIQRMIVGAFEQGAIAPKENAKAFEDAVYEYVRTIPLELFYCRWLKKSITNDASISELAILLTKAKRTKKVPYNDPKGWFEPPESLETAAEKKKVERAQKKKSRAAERKKKRASRKPKARSTA